MTTLTRWVLAHKFVVVAAWVITMLAGFDLGQAATNALSRQFELPGREAYVTNLAIERTFNDVPKTIAAVRTALGGIRIAGAPMHVTGQDVLALGSSGDNNGPSLLAEVILGGAGALLILIFVFRSFMALVPMMMAVVAIPTVFLLVLGLTKITSVSFIVQFLVALIGLGLAIDYSLLVVVRWREERARGLENEAAVLNAMATAGRAVFFSGTTVAIGLLALIVLPVPFLRSLGYGGMLMLTSASRLWRTMGSRWVSSAPLKCSSRAVIQPRLPGDWHGCRVSAAPSRPLTRHGDADQARWSTYSPMPMPAPPRAVTTSRAFVMRPRANRAACGSADRVRWWRILLWQSTDPSRS